MRSSSAGSNPRQCCLQPKLPPCCSGRCSPLVRSLCEKSTAGKPSTVTSLISQLTSLPDPICSYYQRLRQTNSNTDRDVTSNGFKSVSLGRCHINAFHTPMRRGPALDRTTYIQTM